MRLRLASRYSRVLAGVVVILLGIGAFLARGPIGLGNGPLAFGSFSVTGFPDQRGAPVALVIYVINRGRAPAVINGVTLVGGGKGYPAPRLRTVYVTPNTGCATISALTGPGQAIAGSCVSGRFSLAGLAIPASRKVRDQATGDLAAVPTLGLVAEAEPPAAGRCWTMKAMAIHYRVGIRHYTATTHEAGASCGPGASAAQLRAAVASVDG